MLRWVKTVVMAAIGVALCIGPALAGEVRISAAASLREAIGELTRLYGKTHSTTFLCNFGASGTLAQQILAGAPADIFISASEEWIDRVKGKGVVVDQSVRPFTYNSLVFVSRDDSRFAVRAMKDLAQLEKIAIGSPKSVPAGAYAVEALRKSGMERPLQGKLVLAKDVRECLMYAERGEVDGAFVYRSDTVQAKRSVIRFAVGKELVPSVLYPMVLTNQGGKNGAAVEFYRFLQGESAKAVLSKYGFTRR